MNLSLLRKTLPFGSIALELNDARQVTNDLQNLTNKSGEARLSALQEREGKTDQDIYRNFDGHLEACRRRRAPRHRDYPQVGAGELNNRPVNPDGDQPAGKLGRGSGVTGND